jgi:ankyrin repeat protein
MPLLCIASRNGYISFVELLLKYHANINLTTKNNENKTALMLAAEYGHEHVVQLLINHQADVSWIRFLRDILEFFLIFRSV